MTKPVRLAVLWTHPSGYLMSSLQELAKRGHEVLLVSQRPEPNAAFDLDSIAGGRVELSTYDDFGAFQGLSEHLASWSPTAMLICGWHVAAFRRIALSYRGQIPRILYMDNPWQATLRQHLGVAISATYIRPAFDAVLLPGELQAMFARKLGFKTSAIRLGGLACDSTHFGRPPTSTISFAHRPFLYCGRLCPEKGFDVLAEAYELYRRETEHPRPLRVVGAGPLVELALGTAGIQYIGFVQPRSLPSYFYDAASLVVPSRVEHWGVVIHEAATAGLPIIASSICGAIPHLVHEGFNGSIFQSEDSADLADSLRRLHSMPAQLWSKWASHGRLLAAAFTPARWADAVEDLASLTS